MSISDQESDGSEVVVDNAQLSAGGFIAIHAGNASGDVVGNSEYLEPAATRTSKITLDEPMDEVCTASRWRTWTPTATRPTTSPEC